MVAVYRDPAYLDGIGWCLGSQRQTVPEALAAGRVRASAQAFASAGFVSHHVCSDGETAYDLALAAATQAGEKAMTGVGAIIYSTCLPTNANLAGPAEFASSRDVKHLMDFPASRLQRDLDLPDAFVIGLTQQACTAMLGSLRLGTALLGSEAGLDAILCVTADRFPPGALYEQAYNLVSDGAAGCVVSRSPGRYRILAAHHLTRGGLVHAGDDETIGAFFAATGQLMTELMEGCGLQPAQVHRVVTQNTDPRAWRILGPTLGFGPSQIWAPTLAEVGHVISADSLINLAALDDVDRAGGGAQPGDLIILVMAGYGLNTQAVLLERVAAAGPAA
ncbi:MAG: 3-oxoacyl-[acyl-carrier-protein] synthase III C-terminal domain-containing protein [Acidimicrobiales bacterium]